MGCSSDNSINVKESRRNFEEDVEKRVIPENESKNMEQEKKEEDNTAKNETSEIKINNKNENEHKSSKEGKEERDAGVISRQGINRDDPNFVPDQLIDILRESVCRIEIKKPRMISSGFFIKINLKIKEYKFLFTCNHSIPQEIIDLKTKISIYYGKKIEEIKKKIILDKDKRFIKSYKDLDVTIIEIKEEDNISEHRYLCPDLNYKMGLKHYLNAQVYTAGYPNVDINKGDKHYSAGIIKKVDNDEYTFGHNCDTKEGSSGGPIINYDKLVIGIHFGFNKIDNINLGTFIGKIINELFLEEKNINPLMKDDKKEDEKEKEKKSDDRMKGFELGYFILEQMKKNEALMNEEDISGFFQQLTKIIENKPEFKDIICTPEEIEKFMDKDGEINIESFCKYTFEKMGYSKNEQDFLFKSLINLCDIPDFNKSNQNDKMENDDNI